MRNTNEYSILYSNALQSFMFLKEGGSYSFLQEDKSEEDPDVKSYTEVIVPAKALEEALEEIPSSDPYVEPKDKLHLLFGEDGWNRFTQFCDEYNIETRTLFWD